jgi:uncharacterized membrane protein YhhN
MNYQFLLFAMLCVIHICMRDMHREIPSRITKVLLMPSLLWYYLSLQTETGILPVLIIVALALHTAGDLFLLFPKKLAAVFHRRTFVLRRPHLLYQLFLPSLHPSGRIVGRRASFHLPVGVGGETGTERSRPSSDVHLCPGAGH